MISPQLFSELNERRKQDLSSLNDSDIFEKDEKLLDDFANQTKYRVLDSMRNKVISWDNVKEVLEIVDKVLSDNAQAGSRISYDMFKEMSKKVPKSCQKYFTANNFILFPRVDETIEKNDLTRFIERSVEIERAIIDLMEFVKVGDPFTASLTEQQLESFLYVLIPQIDVERKMHPSFHEYYMYTASQKFFFFVDPHRRNSVSVKRVANCSVMQELQYLLRLARRTAEEKDDKEKAGKFESTVAANWFSSSNALKIYSTFLELDKDQNGMLSLEELKNFEGMPPIGNSNPASSGAQFTETAIKRILEEYAIFQPYELDYKGFVNLVIALENLPKRMEALHYFWRVLDVDRSGRLDGRKIKLFYREICESLRNIRYEAPSEEHVVLEVFDLLACNNSEGATFEELVDSKQGHVVITMLLDVNGFWRYDNRESLLANVAEEE